MTDEAPPPKDWYEEGKKHFIASRIKPHAPAKNYPTRDVHSAEDEQRYIDGFNFMKAQWERGEGFSGMQALADELEEQQAAEEAEKKRGAVQTTPES